MSEWTRETLTEQIVSDLRGLLAHMDEVSDAAKNADMLQMVVAVGATAYLRQQSGGTEQFGTHDLLMLACACCQLAREITLADPGSRQRKEA